MRRKKCLAGRASYIALAALTSVSSLACTALTDPTDVQCNVDADCEAKFGEATCSSEKICVSRAANACKDDAECRTALGGDAYCSTEKVCVSLACSTTAECRQRLSEPSYCRSDGTCVKLQNADCKDVYPPSVLQEDDVTVVGFMGPIDTPTAYGVGPRDGAKFALRDFEILRSGLPGIPGGSTSRHVAMLICNHGDDDVQARAVAHHLTDVVKVPAIIGPSYSGITLDVFNKVANSAGVLVISPSATSPDITKLKQSDRDLLLWRTVPSDILQAEALKSLVPIVADAIRGIQSVDEVDVGVTYKEDAAGAGLYEAMIGSSGFPDSPDPVEFMNVVPYDKEADAVDWEDAWARLKKNGYPHIIVALGTDEFPKNLLPIIEQKWPAARPRPWYVMPEGNRSGLLKAFAEAHPELELERRVLGTAPGARRGKEYQSFSTAFEGANGKPPLNLAEFGFDAAYLLAFAIVQAGQRFPTGKELGKSLSYMSCKERGAQVIKGSRTDLDLAAGNDCLDYEGASGPVDFEGPEREVLADMALWCVRTRGGVTVDQNLQTYYALTEFPDASGGARKGLVRQDPGRMLNLEEEDWCNLGTEPLK